MHPDRRVVLGDLNFLESLREQTRSCGGSVVERDGLVLMRGSHPHALHNNVVRTDPALSAVTVMERAHREFGQYGYGFILATLNGEPPLPASELGRVAASAGMATLVAPPAMFLAKPPAATPIADGCELRPVEKREDSDLFAVVSGRAWETYAIPREAVAMIFADGRFLLSPNVHAVVGFSDGKPAAAAMLLMSHGIGGIYWVGTVPEARGRGLAEACTNAMARRAFELGVELVTLQASPMGESIYRRMGFESLGAYRLYAHAGSGTA